MTRHTPREALGPASQRGWLLACLGLLAFIVGADLATDHVSLAGVVVLVPLLASIRLPPRTVAAVGALAVAVAALSWLWAPTAGAQHGVRVALVVAGSVLAVVIAITRTRVERERLLEGLLEQLVASTAESPGELVRRVARALVPEFADGARVTLHPAGVRPAIAGEAGEPLPEAAAPADAAPGLRIVRAAGRGEVLVGPLDVGARRVGEIGLLRTRGRFRADDLDLFDRLADRVALALENSLLLADSRALTSRLDNEHRWLQTVVDQMPSAVMIRDTSGAPLVRNRRAEQIQERASGGGDAQSWFSANPGRRTDGSPVDPGDWPYLRSLRDGEIVTGEDFQFERHDGSWAVVRVSSAPIRDEDDRIVAVVSVFDDTTDQYRDQRALRWLAEVGRLLDRPHTVEMRIEEILELLVDELADAGLIYVCRPDGTLHLSRVVGADDRAALAGLAEQERSLPEDHPASVCVATRSTLEVTRLEADAGHAAWLDRSGLGAALFIPITHGQRNHGCLALAADVPRTQDPRDVKVLELIARRIALALENSVLYAEQHRVATALQRDLLPGALPEWPGLELATLHRPSPSAADVGGDFFDLFDAGDERMLVLGDVSGKGVEAAATTALVRHAVRVAARTDQPAPGRMATVNEAVLEDAPGDQFCTLAWAALRRENGAVSAQVSCAGHPQPFVVRSGGGVEAVAASGTLLGFFEDLRSAGADVRLDPGDALVLFTDGVTEARLPDGSLFGSDGVRDALAAAHDHTADGLLDAIEHALDGAHAEARDDVAIVVGRVRA